MTLNQLLRFVGACPLARARFRGKSARAAYAWIVEHAASNEGGSRYGRQPEDWIVWFVTEVEYRLIGAYSKHEFASWEEREMMALLFLDWITQPGRDEFDIYENILPPHKERVLSIMVSL